MGQSLDASVKYVPRMPSPAGVSGALVSTKRVPSKECGEGYLLVLCMMSYAETQAMSPTAREGPPLEKVKGWRALRRMPTGAGEV